MIRRGVMLALIITLLGSIAWIETTSLSKQIENQLVGIARIAFDDTGIADSQISGQQHAGFQIVDLRNATRVVRNWWMKPASVP